MDIDPRFLKGMIRKAAILGCIVSLLTYALIGAPFAVGVLVGSVISVVNLQIFVSSIFALFNSVDERKEKRATTLWMFLLIIKMSLLIGVIWFCIGVIGVNIAGLVFGFSLFLPSMFWQMIAGPQK